MDRTRQTIGDLLRLHAESQQGRAAFSYVSDAAAEPRTLTYGELYSRAIRLATAIRQFGESGDRVLLVAEGLDFAISFFAILYAGRIAVPAHPPRGTRGIQRLQLIAKDCCARLAIGDDRAIPSKRELWKGIEIRNMRELETEESDSPIDFAGQRDIAFLQYTSGSTGAPKGVMVSNGNILHNVEAIAAAFRQHRDSTLVCWLPLFHDMGLVGNVLLNTFLGSHCILLPPSRVLQDPLEWLRTIDRFNATTSGGPNSVYEMCVQRVARREVESNFNLKTWTIAYNGSEAVREETMDRFSTAFARYGFSSQAFRPCYGLAESTLLVAMGSRQRRHSVGRASCGQPAAGTHVIVVGPDTLRRRKDSQPGEIWISSPSVALGYWNKSDSAEVFQACTIDDPTRAYLRTGDLGVIQNGELYVLDRLKDMIIVRGRNIYAHDVETTIRRAAGRPSAAAAAISVEVGGEERLAVFLEWDSASDEELEETTRVLRTAVALEHDATPAAIVLVRNGILPKTTSGKIQRHECRRFLDEHQGVLRTWRDGAEESNVPAADDARMAIVNWLSKQISIPADAIADDAPIISFGLDSLAVIRLAHAVEAQTGVTLDVAALLSGMTINQAIATSPARTKRDDGGGQAKTGPLSHGQEALVYLDRLQMHTRPYNVSVAMSVRGTLEEPRLHAVLESIHAAHEALRITIDERDGTLFQTVHDDLPIDLGWIDAREWPAEKLEECLRIEANAAFDLAQGPPWRVRAFRAEADRYVVLWILHHAICDLWSLSLLLDDFFVLLAGGTGRTGSSRYLDHVQAEREMLAGKQAAADLAYWKATLAHTPDRLRLPAWRTAHSNGSRGGTVRLLLPARLSGKIRALSTQLGVTNASVLLAGYELALWRFSGAEQFRVGIPYAGRENPRFAETAGYFANLLVLTASLRDHYRFAEVLEQIQRSIAGAIQHGRYPYSLLAREIPAGKREELFDAVFVMHASPHESPVARFAIGAGEPVHVAGMEFAPMAFDPGYAQFDLALTAADVGEQFALELRYRASLFEQRFAAQLLSGVATVLEQAVTNVHAPLSAIQVAASEDAQSAASTLKASANYDSQDTLVSRFERVTATQPEAVALVCGDDQVSYGRLNERANSLARLLVAQGVRPESLVAIYLDRQIELVVAMLATLKAGGAYLPIDRNCPRERLEWLLEDANPAVLISSHSLLPAQLPDSVRIVRMEDTGETKAGRNLDLPIWLEQLAYVIYTSGSTGKPKGCLISHANVIRLFDATENLFHFSSADCWTMFHSPAFDFSVWEIWGALLYGGKLAIPSYDITRSPRAFYGLLHSAGVTVLNQTPTAFCELARVAADTGTRCSKLRYVVFGGERFEPRMLTEWVAIYGFDQPQLVNMYGITETTVHVTHRVLSQSDMQWANESPIGLPLPDLGIRLLDSGLNPLPAGAVGSMFVSGAGVARGYLNRPDSTAGRFLPDPLSDRPGERVYASGDRAVMTPHAGLEYLSRADEQVKIRGHRIEPGEIRAVLAEHPDVRECIVTPYRRKDGDLNLVAYLIPREGTAIDPVRLRAFAGCRLPDYMIPSAYISLPDWPLTSNGKLDRAALPEPVWSSAREFIAPRNATEALLASIFSEVTGVDSVGMEDNYFELGGDSIRSIRVCALARAQGMELSIQDLMNCPTVSALANRVGRISSASEQPAPDAVAVYPLTSVFTGLVFQSQHGSEYESYVTSIRVKLPFDSCALRQAIQRVAERHAILRTTFDFENYSEPMQIVHAEADLEVNETDFQSLPPGQQDVEVAQTFVRLRSARPVWTKLPLARWLVHRHSDDSFRLTLHEPFLDGWSVGLILTDVLKAYCANLPIEPLQTNPQAHVVLEREASASPESARYWEEQLAGLPEMAFPAPVIHRKEDAVSIQRQQLEISGDSLKALRSLATRHGVPIKSVLLAVHMKTLSVMTGQSEVASGILMNGRPETADGDRIAGLFVNPVFLRTRLPRGATWPAIIDGLYRAECELLPHRRFPFAELRRRNGGRDPFPVLFNFTNFHIYRDLERLTGIQVSDVYASEQTYFDLTAQFHIDHSGDSLLIALDYRASRFDGEFIRRMLLCYQRTIEMIAAQPEAVHDAQPLAPVADLQQIAHANATEHWWKESIPLHELIESQVRVSPEAEAVRFQGQSLTYAALNSLANQLARVLRKNGVKPDDVVGVMLDRSLELIPILLAILKAGGAYVPLDSGYPAQRLKSICQDANVRLVVADQFPSINPAPVLAMERLMTLAAAEDTDDLGIDVSPDGLAYVISTSGSTGTPKGAMNTHRGIVNRLLWMQKQYGLRPGERVLQKTPYTFDVSVWELFWPLLPGGCVIVADPGGHLDAEYLAWVVRNERVAIVHFVPPMLRQFLDQTEGEFPSLRQIICSGEALPSSLVQAWYARYGAPLDNLYGPAECSVDVTWHACRPADRGTTAIGAPIANTRVYILDPYLQPAPVGVPGEIFLAGVGVGRGYSGDAVRTAERFLPDPFSGSPGQRMYRTGDRGSWRMDGAIDFHGRIDHQVKIRGQRMELGEIEAALRQLEGVREAVVLVRKSDDKLIAWLVTEGGLPIPAERVRAHAARFLPRYMIPHIFRFRVSLPLNRSGKTDRIQLLAGEQGEVQDRRQELLVQIRSMNDQAVSALLERYASTGTGA